MSTTVRLFPANRVFPHAPAPSSSGSSSAPTLQASVVPAQWPPSNIYSQNPLQIKVTTIAPTVITVRIGPLTRTRFVMPGTQVVQVLAPGEARRLFPPGMNRYAVTVTPNGGSMVLAARSILIVGVPKPQNPRNPLPGATRNPGAHPILNRKVP